MTYEREPDLEKNDGYHDSVIETPLYHLVSDLIHVDVRHQVVDAFVKAPE